MWWRIGRYIRDTEWMFYYSSYVRQVFITVLPRVRVQTKSQACIHWSEATWAAEITKKCNKNTGISSDLSVSFSPTNENQS